MKGLKHFRLDLYSDGWAAVSRYGVKVVKLNTDDFNEAFDFLDRDIHDVLEDIAKLDPEGVRRGREILRQFTYYYS